MLLKSLTLALVFMLMYQANAMPKINPAEVNVVKNTNVNDRLICHEFEVNMPTLCINGGIKRYIEEPMISWRQMDSNLQKQYKESFLNNISYSYKTNYGQTLGYFLSRIANDDNEILLSDISGLPALPKATKSLLNVGWNIILMTDVIKIDVIGLHPRHSPEIFIMDPLNPLSEAIMNYSPKRRKISRWSLQYVFGIDIKSITAGDILYFPAKCYRFCLK